MFPADDNELRVKHPQRGRLLGRGCPDGRGCSDGIADAAGRDRQNGPSSGRIRGNDDSAVGLERVMSVLHADSSILHRDGAAGPRRSTDGRVRESPLLRKRRVRCEPWAVALPLGKYGVGHRRVRSRASKLRFCRPFVLYPDPSCTRRNIWQRRRYLNPSSSEACIRHSLVQEGMELSSQRYIAMSSVSHNCNHKHFTLIKFSLRKISDDGKATKIELRQTTQLTFSRDT